MPVAVIEIIDDVAWRKSFEAVSESKSAGDRWYFDNSFEIEIVVKEY